MDLVHYQQAIGVGAHTTPLGLAMLVAHVQELFSRDRAVFDRTELRGDEIVFHGHIDDEPAPVAPRAPELVAQ